MYIKVFFFEEKKERGSKTYEQMRVRMCERDV